MGRKKTTTAQSAKEWDTSAASADTKTATAPVTTGQTSSRVRSATRKPREPDYQIGPHEHVCARCDHHWDCLIGRMNDKCYVRHAAKTNKGGPFCDLCMHIVMAKRFAVARQLSFPAFLAILGDFMDVE